MCVHFQVCKFAFGFSKSLGTPGLSGTAYNLQGLMHLLVDPVVHHSLGPISFFGVFYAA